MAEGSYKQFCPVAMASEVLCTRWTLIILRELLGGPMRFNELRRGVPRMSPALLSKRLKDLELADIVKRSKAGRGPDLYEYSLTEAGQELKPIVEAVGNWGHRWITTDASLQNLDVTLLMWNMRRNINPEPLPQRRSTIQVIYRDLPAAKRNWWLIVEPGKEADLCYIDPGFDIDLYVTTDLKAMTELWMGYASLAQIKKQDRILLSGDRQLQSSFQTWLGSSVFAGTEKCVA